MTTASETKVNEVYKELKNIVTFLKNKGYGSTELRLTFSVRIEEVEAICELLKQDGLGVRQEGRWNLQIIWNDVEKTCFYGRDISMAPSYNIIQSLEFQYPNEIK